MKFNILFAVVFLSMLVYASADFITGIVGATQLNGEGCTCHSLTPSSSVNVWIEGPDTIALGETKQYMVYLSGGPAIQGGFNAASRFNDISPEDTSVIETDDELTHNFPKPFPGINDTINWRFNYTAVAEGWDTLYSAGNSVNGNGVPNGDQWNFGNKFPVFVTPPIPVELFSFTAMQIESGIQLFWTTASESNNNGFEIERQVLSEGLLSESNDYGTGRWKGIGFVEGKGTTSEIQNYQFTDLSVSPGNYLYRLKQIDFNGSFEYSNIVSAEFMIKSFILNQNYPNPFNPVTAIAFTVPHNGYLNLKIYNIQGELVEILSEGIISAGKYSVKWDASSFTSGVYFYRINFEDKQGLTFSEVKKMILAK